MAARVRKRRLFKPGPTDTKAQFNEYGQGIKRKAKAQMLKFSDVDNDINIGDDSPEENKSDNSNVEEVRCFTEPSTDDVLQNQAQMLKFSDVDNDINIGDDSPEVNQRHTPEENKSDNSNVEEVRCFTEPSTDSEVEELMDGICPEDLSFSTSYIGMTTPQKNVDNPPRPLHESTPNVNSSDKTITSSPPVTEKKPSDTVRASGTPSSKISKSVVEQVNKILGPDFQGFKSSSSEVKNTSLKQCDQLTVYPKGTFYGLPEDVLKCLEEFKGIKKLYEWQDYCLRLSCLAENKNLIYSLPTSGGKTLVAEILIFQYLLLRKQDVLFILPFVAIVQEKVQELTPFAAKFDFTVEEYAASKGRLPPHQRKKRNVVYVATIEKANSLVNCLIEVDRIKSLGLVIIDELHMLGEGGMRGATLELCLSKLLYSNANSTQLIGMSATLSNINELACFLNAEVYSNDFRPVELHEYVKVGRTLYTIRNSNQIDRIELVPHRTLNHKTDMDKLDIDQLATLALEIIPDSSCLIFCPTKKNCQNVALLLTKLLPSSLLEHRKDSKLQLLGALKVEASGLCSVLKETIPFGIAYHNSGLTSDERKLIEAAYHDGTLCVITCTSTLAAGVNLPAKRVILRAPYIGNQLMTFSQYKQMVGRAGRAGFDDNSGESILILQPKDGEKVLEVLKGPYSRCNSNLLINNYQAMHSLVLTLVGLKLISTNNDLKHFLSKTLCYVQQGSSNLYEQTGQVLDYLHKLELITGKRILDCDIVTYETTPLGRATYKGSVVVNTAHAVYRELVTAQQKFVLSNDLHMLYLCIPLELVTSIDPNWRIFFDKVTKLEGDELSVAQILDVSEAYLSKKFSGVASKLSEDKEVVYRKFYLSLILNSLLKQPGNGVWLVAEQFECSRGFVQNALHSTASFASGLVHFTEEIPELRSVHLLLPYLVKKLASMGSPDTIALLEIPGVKLGRAKQLVAAGYKNIEDIAKADHRELSKNITSLFLTPAINMILSAKALIRDKAELLREEADEIMNLFP